MPNARFLIIITLQTTGTNTMKKLTSGLSLSLGLLLIGFSQSAFAGQTTTFTGPYGGTSTRTFSNGQQTINRTGPYGGTQQINRDFVNGQQTSTFTGPKGGTSTRTLGNGQQTITRKGPYGGLQQTTRTIYP
jgi:hypothetical protein